jgi:transposase
VEFLDEEIKTLLQAIRDHIDRNDALKHRRQLLKSIPGLGEKTIPWLLSYLSDGHKFDKGKQVVAYAGLNPQHCESGTSVHGKQRVSKIGQADLRGALYMPAVVVFSRSAFFRPFVDRLKAAGKPAKLIIVALMRKLLTLAHAILKSGQPFDPNYAKNA